MLFRSVDHSVHEKEYVHSCVEARKVEVLEAGVAESACFELEPERVGAELTPLGFLVWQMSCSYSPARQTIHLTDSFERQTRPHFPQRTATLCSCS